MKATLLAAVALCCASLSLVQAQDAGAQPPVLPIPQSPVNSNPLPADTRPVSWKKLLPNVADDQREIWTFPRRLGRKKILLPALGVLAVTAGLIALDPVEAKYFKGAGAYNGFNTAFSGTATAIGTGLAPGILYATGLLKKDCYAQNTALLSAEAIGDSEIVDFIMKRAFSRVRPGSLPPNTRFGDTWFEAKNGVLNGDGSFPSGHAIAAFSVATVISRRYSNHKWVPWLAYGLAGAVSFSRLSLQAHFGADIFMGAALGYSISRFSVLRQ